MSQWQSFQFFPLWHTQRWSESSHLNNTWTHDCAHSAIIIVLLNSVELFVCVCVCAHAVGVNFGSNATKSYEADKEEEEEIKDRHWCQRRIIHLFFFAVADLWLLQLQNMLSLTLSATDAQTSPAQKIINDCVITHNAIIRVYCMYFPICYLLLKRPVSPFKWQRKTTTANDTNENTVKDKEKTKVEDRKLKVHSTFLRLLP